MIYEKMLKDHLIKKQKPDFDQIKNQINRAKKDLNTAESVSRVDLTWSFTIAYHAMMRASKSLMFSKGYLPTTKSSHKTVVEFTRSILGKKYEDIIFQFNRMRRKRHDFIYDAQNRTTITEVKSAINTAKVLIEKINLLIKNGETQGDLF